MKVIIYRYQFLAPKWSNETITGDLLDKLRNAIIKLPLEGSNENYQFGFAQCEIIEDKIIGVFIQKFPKLLTDYHPQTKVESQTESKDCGEYLFLIDLPNFEVYLQAKRSIDLPSNEEIRRRFILLLKTVMIKNNLLSFEDITETNDETDRDRIIKIFYEEADSVLELDLEDFDPNLVEEEKRKRNGKRQTYFNPIEEYQEAMEAGAIKAALNTDKAMMKAKKNHSLKKDPIARALLEGSRKPTKIIYKKDDEIITEFGVMKSKVEFIVETETYNLKDQAKGIVEDILGTLRTTKRRKKKNDDSQLNLGL